ALVGPAQVAARLFEFGLLRSFHPLIPARIALLLHPLGAAALAVFGPAAINVLAVLHGAGNGMLTIANGTLPLAIFGPADYGKRNGYLAVPTRVAESAAPFLFGLLIDRIGTAALAVSAGLMLAAFASLFALSSRKTVAAPI
ncbi:MAG: MFS transporter, partial [Stellaceae bacterium]